MTNYALVTGAGGFIGSHLVNRLRRDGFWVRGVDIKKPQWGPSAANQFQILDLREYHSCVLALDGISDVYNLAADMGGIGYIGTKLAEIARHNTLINLNMLEASRHANISRYFFSSSACVYPLYKQTVENVQPLAESDVFPYDPEPGYGWEKLYTEKMCEYYLKEYGLQIRIARFHNVFGPEGTYDGGKEKAPAALCRKIALAEDGEEIEIWGDGEQTRSFLYIEDCIDGVRKLMASGITTPVNIGSDRLVTINQMVDRIENIAGKTLRRKYNKTACQGVRGRCSDNSFVKANLDWEPKYTLEWGLMKTYYWIQERVGVGVL